MSFPETLVLAACLVAAPGFAANQAAWEGWGELIGEPELDAMIESALDQSSSIAASRVSTRVRALETRLSRVARHPDIDLGAALRTGREDTASTGFMEADVARWDLSGTARLDLDVFGALRARTRGAYQAERVAGLELRNHELAWAAEMARLLVRLRYHQREEDTREAMVKTQKISRDWARGRVEAGLISASELEAYESRLLQARQDHLAASESLAVLGSQWSYLAAEDRIPVLSPTLPGNVPKAPPPEDLHIWAMNRPDVQAAYAAWLGADYDATATKKSRHPSLAAVASARGEGPSPVQDPDEWTAWAGLQLALPLWAPKDKARAERDREQVLVEEAMYQDVILAGLKDLQQAYARRWHSEASWALASEEAARFQERLATAQRKLGQGLIMRTEVESACNQWLAATDRAGRAHALLLSHHLDLVQAGGGPGIGLEEGP